MVKIETVRHSLTHILAYAVQELYPGTKFGIGPAIENGFYYDFDFVEIEKSKIPDGVEDPRWQSHRDKNQKITPNDLSRIEKRMGELIKQNIKFEKKIISTKEAKKIFKNQPYKLELIKEAIGSSSLSVYKSGDFVDLCKGPHIKSTLQLYSGQAKEVVNAFKLTKIAGAYWKGKEKNPMLTRIYGLAFETKKELEQYLKNKEEAEKRDHRILGKKLDLFIFSDLVGKGLPLFTEKGSIIRRELERFIVDEEIKRGYKHVYTPELAKVELYKTSGHYPYYKDSMYPIMKIDNEELILRPMTCPHHYQLYADKPRSYKELPFKIAELARQFRYEKSGELSGLMRVRTFCLADSHIICTKDQAEDEINNVLNLIEYIAQTLGFEKGKDYHYRLSLGGEKDKKKYFKDDKAWNFAENVLRKVLKKRKSPFVEADKEAAFYGPKIDIQMKNFAGKEDTAFTVQYDFISPKRFNLSYTDKDGKKKEPIVIHRSSIGSIERTIAFLIEHYKGDFPLWLSPIQVWIIPIGAGHQKYAKKIVKKLEKANIRYELRDENETVSKKIREGEIQKIPYFFVVGDKEIKTKSVRIRKRGKGDIGMMKLDKFIEKVQKEIDAKK